MESCKEKQENLLDFVSNNLSDSEVQVLRVHLQDCRQCAQEKEAIAQIWDALSSLEEVDVPETLREETMGLIYLLLDKKGWWTSLVGRFVPLDLGYRKPLASVSLANHKSRFGTLVNLVNTMAAIIFGIVMILLYGLILTQRVNLEHLTAGKLVATIVIWSGIFISAFSFLFSRYRINKINLGFAAAVGIVATGVTMVGAFFCPETTFFHMWMSSKMGASIAKMTGVAGSHFFFGIVYGVLPAIFSATILGFKFKGDIAKNGLIAAFSFVILMLPAAYLQCKYLSLWAIMISFSVGAFSGATVGVFAGLGVTRLKRRWSAA